MCYKKKILILRLKNFLEAFQLENKINQLEKNKVNADNLRENHKGFIKSKKLILKSLKRFSSENYNAFAEEVKMALSGNSDKKIHAIDSIETSVYGPNKDLVRKKGETKYNNMIKPYKKWLTLMMLRKKT